MKKMSKKIAIFSAILVLLAGISYLGITAVNAQEGQEPADDSRITAFTITPANTQAGEPTTYAVSLTTNTDILAEEYAEGELGIRTFIRLDMASGSCPEGTEWLDCMPDLTGASFSGISAAPAEEQFSDKNNLQFVINSSIPAGTTNFNIDGVVNPTQGGGYYQGILALQTQDVNPGEGGVWPEKESTQFLVGTIAFVGKILTPAEEVVQDVGANLHSVDFSVNIGSGVDEQGNFVIPGEQLTVGQSYILEFWVPSTVQGYSAPPLIDVIYSGSVTDIGTKYLVAATKTISGQVKYDNGAIVTAAQISAWQPGMGGGSGTEVDSSGNYSFTVAGGTYELNVNAPWDPETNMQEDVDWTYNQQPKRIEFKNDTSTETITVNFNVQKTDAKIKGQVKLPNGNYLTRGGVDLRQGEGMGMGMGLDQNGKFTANVMAGTYKLSVMPDMQDATLAKYYLPEMKVTVISGETLNLGILTMSKKTSYISGKVTLEDKTTVEGAMINCWQNGGGGWGNTTTGSDGVWTIYLAPGNWQCEVQTGRDSNYIPVRAGGPPVFYTLKGNDSVQNVNFVVQEADAHIVVRTVGVDGAAITEGMYGYAYARVKGGDWGPGSEFGSGLDRGESTIPLIGGKTYIVGTYVSPESGYLLDEEAEITVAAGETASTTLTLIQPDAKIKGFVKDQNSKAITGVEMEVNAMLAEQMGPGGGPSAHTRVNTQDGSFTLRVRGGSGYKYMLNTWTQGNTDFLNSPPNEKPFSVAVNGSVNKVITVFRADTYADVTLLDPAGKQMDYGFVWCSNRREMEDKIKGDFEGGKIIDTGTDLREGKGRLPLLTGKYNCGSGGGKEMDKYMPPDMVEIDVSPTAPADITLQFREADATVKATVTKEDGTAPQMGFCHAWTQEGGFSGGEIRDGEASIALTLGSWMIGCDSMVPGQEEFYRSEEKLVNVTEKGEIAEDFVVTKSDFQIPEGYTEVFDATQQKTITLPDGTVVNMPANSIATSGDINFMASPDINLFFTATDKPINFAWNFEVLDENQQLISEFQSTVTITIPYDEEALTERGLDESNVFAKYFNETNSSWQLPDGAIQDLDANTYTVSVTHFTNFALTTSENSNEIEQIVMESGMAPSNLIATAAKDGGPQVAVYTKDGNMIATWFAYPATLRLGIKALAYDLDGNGETEVVTYPTQGFPSQIRIFDKNGTVLSQFFAYDTGYKDGIDVTAYDLDGDGASEIITSPTGASQTADIRVYDRNGRLLAEFAAMNGPAKVAARDLNGDGTGEIVVYPIAQSGQVRIFNKDGNVLAQFEAYGATYDKGLNLTLADLDGNGTVEIITGTKNTVAQVKTFDANGNTLNQFYGYAETFRGGVVPQVGDVNGDGLGEIVVLPDTNGAAQARIFTKDGAVLAQFFAYPTTIRGSFEAVLADLDGNGSADITFAPQEGLGPQARVFNQDGRVLSQFFTLHTGFRGGIHLAPIAQ